MADTIIIIRGNSGSGKTTVANKLCDKLGEDCMLLSQDVIRRDILHTNDGKDSTAVDLLKELVLFGKKHSGIIVLEGILNSSWYKPFEETVKRFQTKNNTTYTTQDMKRWYNEKDLLGFENEKIILKDMTIDDTLKMILSDIKNRDIG